MSNDNDALEALADQIESANADSFRGPRSLIHEAGMRLLQLDADLRRQIVMLDAEAFESAALMLIPEHWAIESLTYWPVPAEYAETAGGYIEKPARVSLAACSPWRFGKKTFYGHGGGDPRVEARAATIAHAITAAALRAKAKS